MARRTLVYGNDQGNAMATYGNGLWKWESAKRQLSQAPLELNRAPERSAPADKEPDPVAGSEDTSRATYSIVQGLRHRR